MVSTIVCSLPVVAFKLQPTLNFITIATLSDGSHDGSYMLHSHTGLISDIRIESQQPSATFIHPCFGASITRIEYRTPRLGPRSSPPQLPTIAGMTLRSPYSTFFAIVRRVTSYWLTSNSCLIPLRLYIREMTTGYV